MDLSELERLEATLTGVFSPASRRDLIQESARSGIPLEEFAEQYRLARENMESDEAYTARNQEQTLGDILTLAIINTYKAHSNSQE